MLAGAVLCWAACSWSPRRCLGGRVPSWGGWEGGGGGTGCVSSQQDEGEEGGWGEDPAPGQLLSPPGRKQLGLLLLGSQGQTWPLWWLGWVSDAGSRCSWWCAGRCSDTDVGLPGCHVSASLAVCASAVLPEAFRPHSRGRVGLSALLGA